jgi:hypothetical protein
MPSFSQILYELQTERNKMQQELHRLDSAIAALRGVTRPSHNNATAEHPRQMSTAARKKISDAKKAWWAKKNHTSQAKPARPVLSIVARRKIAAAQRARWAKWKANHGKTAKAA